VDSSAWARAPWSQFRWHHRQATSFSAPPPAKSANACVGMLPNDRVKSSQGAPPPKLRDSGETSLRESPRPLHELPQPRIERGSSAARADAAVGVRSPAMVRRSPIPRNGPFASSMACVKASWSGPPASVGLDSSTERCHQGRGAIRVEGPSGSRGWWDSPVGLDTSTERCRREGTRAVKWREVMWRATSGVTVNVKSDAVGLTITTGGVNVNVKSDAVGLTITDETRSDGATDRPSTSTRSCHVIHQERQANASSVTIASPNCHIKGRALLAPWPYTNPRHQQAAVDAAMAGS
jgi:hypothetical protein